MTAEERERDGAYADAHRFHLKYIGAVLFLPGHYVALRRHEGQFFLLDSEANAPVPVDATDFLLRRRVHRVFHTWKS